MSLKPFDASAVLPDSLDRESIKSYIVASLIPGEEYLSADIMEYLSPLLKEKDSQFVFSLGTLIRILSQLCDSGQINAKTERRMMVYSKASSSPAQENESRVEASNLVDVDDSKKIDNLLLRGKEFLEDELWAEADKCFDSVLNLDYTCKDARIGCVFARLGCKSAEELQTALKKGDYSEDKQIAKAVGLFEGQMRLNLEWALYERASEKKCIIEGTILGDVRNRPDDFESVKIPYLTIPKRVTRIHPNNITSPVFWYCNEFLKGVNIPYGVEEIEEGTFDAMEKLEWVVLPKSVKSIQKQAFNACKNIEILVVPDSVTEIGTYSFSFLENAKTIVLSENLTVLPQGAFYSLPSIETIVIPKSVKRIEEGNFSSAGKLTSLYLPAELEFIHKDAFMHLKNLTRVVIYSSSQENLSDSYPAGYFEHKYPNACIEYKLQSPNVRLLLPNEIAALRRYSADVQEEDANEVLLDNCKVSEDDAIESVPKSIQPAENDVVIPPVSIPAEESNHHFEQTLAQFKAAESQVSIGNRSLVKCPRCYGIMEAVGERAGGFSGKKAAVGGLLFGAKGLLAGALGSKKTCYRCPKCGYSIEK